MNAPLDPFALGQVPPWDPEAERTILGAAMLGEPMPPWLAPSHFFPSQHQRIFETIQSVGGSLPLVAARLREDGRLFRSELGLDRHSKPFMLDSVDLSEMAWEAQWHLSMGWALQFDLLLEMVKRRELMRVLGRCATLLRAGEATHGDCFGMLKEHFKEMKGWAL